VVELSEKKWGESGGDNEGPALLLTLADRNPDVEWVVVGKNSGWEPPRDNITNPWQEWGAALKMPAGTHMYDRIRRLDEVTMPTFDGLDGVIMWLGQHGSSNSPIPKIDDRSVYTKPHESFIAYGSFLLRGINYWRRESPIEREEIWLLPDARNYLKARDLKWPRRHPLLCQYDWKRKEWCERYEDPRSPEELGFTDVTVNNGKWKATDRYVGSGLELVGIPEPKPLDDLPGWEDRHHFGILINEARAYGMRTELTRMDAMQRFVKPLEPAWVHGTWPQKSLEKLEMDITPMPYSEIFDAMASTKTTFTTPSSGSQWATAKPWEAFGTGTICFFHPLYDTQGLIIPRSETDDSPQWTDEDRYLAQWLRIATPEQLAARVKHVEENRDIYEWLARAQYALLKRELAAQRCVTTIEARLGL
jgi:hypothetical protein